MYYVIKPTDTDLQHHGILGMKWGVRRYQSYDTVPRGSGKKGKEIGKAQHKEATSIRKGKSATSLTNEELRKHNERYELEKTFNQAKTEDREKRMKTVKTVATVAGVAGLAVAGYKFMKNNPNLLKNKVKEAAKEAVVETVKTEVNKMVSTMKDVRVSSSKTDFAKLYVSNPAVKTVVKVGDTITGRGQAAKYYTSPHPNRTTASRSNFGKSYVNTMNKILPKELQRGRRR